MVLAKERIVREGAATHPLSQGLAAAVVLRARARAEVQRGEPDLA